MLFLMFLKVAFGGQGFLLGTTMGLCPLEPLLWLDFELIEQFAAEIIAFDPFESVFDSLANAVWAILIVFNDARGPQERRP